ncbi:MAG: hypothetical protein IJY80_06795 [Opitutales bacterium]|nr:hypothetical protein [Opitutales bacterium]
MAQFLLLILAKKKSGSASPFFAGTKKKMGGQTSGLSPGFFRNSKIGERSELVPLRRENSPLFSSKLKASSLMRIEEKAFILEHDA